MSDAKVRKAVVKTEDVQVALNEYTDLYSKVSGQASPALEIDRGPRGGEAFAVYVKGTDTLVKGFETKEAARDHYATYVAVAHEITGALAARGLISEGDLKVVEESTDKPKPTTRKVAEKPAA